MPPLRLPADPDARVRGHRALRADVGAGSDVVQKEMYTFEDRSGRSLTLRPEGTAPICRAYVEHGMHREPQPAKLYTIGTMYRYSAPQRGRHREHWQLSVEAIGSDEPSVDAEVIQLYHALLERLGVNDFELALNSIGCRECRPAYLELLRAWLDANLDRLDAATREKAATSPLRVFDNLEAKPAATQEALREAPTIGDSLCAACREHLRPSAEDLDACGVAYALVPTLVRGLDYYTRTTWEFVGPDEGPRARSRAGALRRPRRGDRRAPDAGSRLRCRDRAAPARARARGRRGGAPAIDVFFALEDGAAARAGRHLAPRSPRARARLRHRLRRTLAEGPADAGRAGSARPPPSSCAPTGRRSAAWDRPTRTWRSTTSPRELRP